MYAVQQQGYTPILAHVERYPYVTEDPTLLYRWVAAGALAQVNAAGLIRGGHTAKLLHKYLHWNLVHLLATDAHHPERRPVNLRAGYEALSGKNRRAPAPERHPGLSWPGRRPRRAHRTQVPLWPVGINTQQKTPPRCFGSAGAWLLWGWRGDHSRTMMLLPVISAGTSRPM